MTNEQVLKVVASYVEAIDAPPVRCRLDQLVGLPGDGPEALSHLSWMCSQIPEMLVVGRMDKVNRWLGFIQGSMWTLGVKTIDEMREDNK